VAVQVWIGEKPEHANERRAIMGLANGLARLEGLHLILANFSVGGRNIDVVVIKQDAIFIIELKHCDGKVFGSVNGRWRVESSNGVEKFLNPGRKNPYNQVISYFYSLTNFLSEHRQEFLSPQKAEVTDFRTSKRLVVIAPTIQEGSEIELDWKVDIKGLDELPAYLVTERSNGIDLSDSEMLAIPELLHCTRWGDVDALVAGSVTVDGEPAPPPAPTSQPPEAAPATTPAAGALPSLWQRARVGLFGSWTGRLALTLALLVVLLGGALLWRGTSPAVVAIDQPNTSLIVVTQPPTGGEGGGGRFQPSEIWAEYQPIGRRRSLDGTGWVNVGVEGTAPDLAPEVVVVLEQVDFRDRQIALTWSLHNATDETVRLPLTAENIVVRDTQNNEYIIDDTLSVPARVLEAGPNERVRGTAIVPTGVNINALAINVKLKTLPFGEATWLVSTGR
jgi:hypothetical protein